MTKEVIRFLTESNLIEGVGNEGLEDSIKAYNYLMQVKPPLQEKHILKIHKLLMRRLYPKIAGKIRTAPVGIYSGGICIKKCPLPKEIKNLLEIVLHKINCDVFDKEFRIVKREKENFTKDCHIYFEETHPFEDGNGRVGRLILNWHRKQRGLPLLIIYNSNKQEYYSWFK